MSSAWLGCHLGLGCHLALVHLLIRGWVRAILQLHIAALGCSGLVFELLLEPLHLRNGNLGFGLALDYISNH